MKVISKEEFLENKEFYISEIILGKIFIFPTDTIYGIGCNATNSIAVEIIRITKQREEKPFSVIASKNWIKQNCILLDYEIFKKYNSKCTLILNLKNKNSIAQNVINCSNTIGIRISDNWFSDILQEIHIPFVATSVNITGEKHILSKEDLSKEILKFVNYFIDDGKLDSSPSRILDLTNFDDIKIIRN